MNVIVKEIKEDGSELLIYLMDEHDRAVKAKICKDEEREEYINTLIMEEILRTEAEVIVQIKEIKYKEYIS